LGACGVQQDAHKLAGDARQEVANSTDSQRIEAVWSGVFSTRNILAL
jgi:hypothetical protein